MAPDGRAKAIPTPSWWRDEVFLRLRIAKAKRKLSETARSLEAQSDYKKGFSPGALSRILDETLSITLEFAIAASQLYRLPMPVFYPESREEALEYEHIHRQYERPEPARIAAHEERMKALRKELEAVERPATVAQVEERLTDKAKQLARRRSARFQATERAAVQAAERDLSRQRPKK